ncbi:hypothetical protein GGX14DRAFT_545088 [Mycena pura]|uniref:Uncharacterized protein n=1 Tax=Mycena pura TaxID=153505 RepID=A0AAD6V066_9AGAR|nr:hypothetical protein GGX14DRAFT_545088 [Mycena pura]
MASSCSKDVKKGAERVCTRVKVVSGAYGNFIASLHPDPQFENVRLVINVWLPFAIYSMTRNASKLSHGGWLTNAMVFTPVPTTAMVSLTTTAVVALGDVCARPEPGRSTSGSAELHPRCHKRSPRRARIPSATSRPPELPDDLLTRGPLHTLPISRTRIAHTAPYAHAAALSRRTHALGILRHPPNVIHRVIVGDISNTTLTTLVQPRHPHSSSALAFKCGTQRSSSTQTATDAVPVNHFFLLLDSHHAALGTPAALMALFPTPTCSEADRTLVGELPGRVNRRVDRRLSSPEGARAPRKLETCINIPAVEPSAARFRVNAAGAIEILLDSDSDDGAGPAPRRITLPSPPPSSPATLPRAAPTPSPPTPDVSPVAALAPLPAAAPPELPPLVSSESAHREDVGDGRALRIRRASRVHFGGIPSIWGIPRMPTTLVADLEFLIERARGKLWTPDGLVKNKDNDSWDGGSGAADSKVMVTYHPDLPPELSRRVRMSCKGQRPRPHQFASDKHGRRGRIPCLLKSHSPIAANDWDRTPSTTNAGEAQHAWTKKQTGIKLAPVVATETACEVDADVCEELRTSAASGVLTNSLNEATNRRRTGAGGCATPPISPSLVDACSGTKRPRSCCHHSPSRDTVLFNPGSAA